MGRKALMALVVIIFSSFNSFNNNLNSFYREYNSLSASTKIYKLSFILIDMNKRVKFEKGFQKKFIQALKNKTNYSWSELSNKLGIKENTLSKSYLFELSTIPYDAFVKICRIIKSDEVNLLKKYRAKIIDEQIIIGRKVLGEQKKTFDEISITFKNNNINLDLSKINYSSADLEKNIKLPIKLSPELAEEIGMHYGDGFLSNKKYTYRLKGNIKDEKEYYKNYIKPLFKKLYNLDLDLKEFDSVFGFELYSKALWEFKVKVIGIQPGNKENITIPEKLKVNDIKILTSFLRGLFDTDGCIYFKTRYGYDRYYPNIAIKLYSKKLIQDVADILKMLGFNPNVYIKKEYGLISLNGIEVLRRYEELIGWRSQKNLNKINNWKKRYTQLNGKNMAIVAQWLERPVVVRETGVRFPPFASEDKSTLSADLVHCF